MNTPDTENGVSLPYPKDAIPEGFAEEVLNMKPFEFDTPDTERTGVVIDKSPRGQLISLLGAVALDFAKPWVDEAIAEATSSRDTYWKERVGKAVNDGYKLAVKHLEEAYQANATTTVPEIIEWLRDNARLSHQIDND